MKSFLTLLFAIISIGFFSSCQKVKGEGEITTEERPTTRFTDVNSEIGDKVIITQGGDYKITINGQQNIINQIETFVEYNKLTIRYKSGAKIESHKPLEVFVNLPELKHVLLNGSGDMVLLHQIEANNLAFSILGSGKIIADAVHSNTITTNINGTGSLEVSSGKTRTETLNLFGSGHIDFSNMVADTATVVLSGSGDIKVNVTNYLEAKISGSGTIYYTGDPEIIKDIKGSGEVKPL